ncbi:hypothetical protein R1flu_022333 [Riccia fluitans]|uniref:UspA domain-containing protein n=1 Tax=Riccia fluitans TaxID=41844 RepID=A0ABD1ZS77_9MARC
MKRVLQLRAQIGSGGRSFRSVSHFWVEGIVRLRFCRLLRSHPERSYNLNHMEEIETKPEVEAEPTVILLGVSASTIKGYPFPSQSSTHALEWTLEKLIKKSCRNEYKLLILHVQVPDEDGFDEVDSIFASPADFTEAHESDRRKSSQLLKFFVNKCHEAEVPCEGRIKKGDPKEVICQEVKRLKPDILLLGSRGLGPLQRIFVGGVSDYCAKKADCPVLVIKRRPEDMPDDASED